MQKGSAGMGMHKHAVSGHPPKSTKDKNADARRANAEIERVAALRRKRAKAYQKFDTPSAAFRSHKNV